MKHAIERALILAGISHVARFLRRRDVVVLAYHNLIPERCRVRGDTSLHLRFGDFRRQLSEISRTHDVVPLDDVLTSTERRRRPRVVITFDDAYTGAIELGVAELVRRGLPATVFVAPGILLQHTWWDLLADPRIGAVAPSLRDRLLTESAGDTRAVLARSDLPLAPAVLSDEFRIASEAEIAAASKKSGISVGSHTWSHSNLLALPPDAIRAELETSMTWLRARFASFVPWLSYPYGLCSESTGALARGAGYTGAVRVEGGWVRDVGPRDVHLLPRLNVPAGLSLDGFRLRLSGMLA